MSIAYCRQTRRQFLVGAGNSLLALPILPSLLPSYARAQAVTAPRRMMILHMEHNNAQELWPLPSIATTPVGSIGTRETLLRSLSSATAMSSTMTNPVYNSLRLRDQITMVRGLDIEAWDAHGNRTLACGEGRYSEGNFPTMDTVIEACPSLYPSSTPTTVTRAVRTLFGGESIYFSKVGSSVQRVPTYGQDSNDYYRSIDEYTVHRLWRDLFGALGPSPGATTNQLKAGILNRVFSSYQSFRNNRKIATEDIARVDQHLGFISDLERNYANMGTTISCTRPAEPTQSADPLVYMPIYMDLLVVAFKCGLTKFSILQPESHDPRWLPGLNFSGTAVHDMFHGDAGPTAKRNAFECFQNYNIGLLASRFLTPMDQPEGNTGRTYLENMATVILHTGGVESYVGGSGHSCYDLHHTIIGSMGGSLRSGRYYAFPQTNNRRLPQNCFLISLLQLLGIPQSEYAFATPDGRGFGWYPSASGHPFASRFYSPLTEMLT